MCPPGIDFAYRHICFPFVDYDPPTSNDPPLDDRSGGQNAPRGGHLGGGEVNWLLVTATPCAKSCAKPNKNTPTLPIELAQ